MLPILQDRYEAARKNVRLCCIRRVWPNLERYHKPRIPCSSLREMLVVVFLTEVGDQILAHHPAQRVFQLHGLDEQIVLWVELRAGHRRLEVEAQPLLDAAEARALREVEKNHEVQHDGRGQN